MFFFFFFKQKTAYEMRISDWSSDVCSSDLLRLARIIEGAGNREMADGALDMPRAGADIGVVPVAVAAAAVAQRRRGDEHPLRLGLDRRGARVRGEDGRASGRGRGCHNV